MSILVLARLLLTFLLLSPPQLLPSVQPISSPDGITFCSAFSVNEQQRLYLTAAHCVDEKEIDLPIPLMFSQRVKILKADAHTDIALIQAALGTRGLELATQPVGPGGAVVASGFIGGQNERALLSSFTGTFYANAIGMDENHELHVFSSFSVRVERGMSGGPILNTDGRVVSMIQLKFPENIAGGILLQFLHTFLVR